MLLKDIARLAINRIQKVKIFLLKSLRIAKIYSANLDGIDNRKAQLEIVIFSKDRPLQLLALLESMDHYSTPKILPHIIFNASSLIYKQAYEELFQKYSHLLKTKYNDSELGFKKTLVSILENLESEKITFLVDDIIFKAELNWDTVIGFDSAKVVPTLRLAPHLKRCYTANDSQLLPPFMEKNNFFWWFWNEGEYDWKYPLSVDGNIFSRHEFLELIKELDFKAPNTLEFKLQKFKHLFINRLGLCFHESIIVNNPINKVQSEINNLHGKIHQDELLKKFQENKKIDYLKFKGLKNISAHEELEFTFIPEVI
jgi:hypothetical protein